MSTDITLEVEPDATMVDFDTYAHRGSDDVIRAIAVAINDGPTASSALTAAFTAARTKWDDPAVQEDPDRFIFSSAIAHVIDERATTGLTDPAALTPLVGPACTVAHFGLRWQIPTISSALDLSPEAVEHHLERARTAGIAHYPSLQAGLDVRVQVRQLLADAEPPMIDVKRISRRHRWGARWRRWKVAGFAALALLISLVLLAQLVARPDRLEQDEAEAPSPTPAATSVTSDQNSTAATSVTSDQNSTAAAIAGEIGTEPRADLVPTPELIATDGEGGFVGVRSASPQNPQIVFTRSVDGQTWSLASRWNLGRDTVIDRFERSGDYYMAWLSNVATTSDNVIGTVGITRDLIAWTVVELALDDQAPFGLFLDPQITDLSVSGNNILALVTTTVEINFAALSVSESYTCGQTITDDEVIVNLCNAEIDVLSLSDAASLPARNRLFVSSDGRPFAETSVPFDSQTAAHLTSVNGAFAITDEAGLRFATSTDGVNWSTIIAGKPSFPVQAAATNESNQVVGVGVVGDNVVLFRNDVRTGEITRTPVSDLIGEVGPDVRAVVASGPTQWMIYLFEPEARAWLLSSSDGITWRSRPTRPSPPIRSQPRLLVGDDEAVVQWTTTEGRTTVAIPLAQDDPG